MAALVCAVLAVLGWRHRTRPGGAPFVFMMAAGAVWALFYSLEITASDLTEAVTWARAEYLGIAATPLAWFLFARRYTGSSPIRRVPLFMVAFVPAATVIMAATNQFHHLLWSEIAQDASGSFPVLDITHGPWFWVYTAFAYALLLAGSVILVRTVLQYPRLYRRQAAILLFAIVAPWLGNALSLFHLLPGPPLDVTPFAFAVAGIALFLALSRFRFFSLLPALLPTAQSRVLEKMRDGVIVLDADGRVVSANPAAGVMLGEGVTGLGGRQAAEIFGGQFVTPGEGDPDSQFEVTLGDAGSLRRYDVVSSALGSGPGLGAGRMLVLRDITERTLMQARVARSEEHFRALIENACDLVAVVDEMGLIQFQSPSSQDILGYRPEELMGQSVFTFMPDDDIAGARKRLAELAAGDPEGSDSAELLFRHRDGTLRVLEVKARRLATSTDGLSFVVNSRDMTERRRMEESLRDRERRYRMLFDSANDGVIVHGLDGRVYEANQVMAERLGVDRAVLLGMNVQDVRTSSARWAFDQQMQAIIDKGSLIFETSHRGADGRVVPVEVSSRLLGTDEPAVVLSISRDISERKSAEEALQASQARLENAMNLAGLVDWEFDAQAGVYTFNDRFYALYGTTAEREGGYSMPAHVYLERFVHPDDRQPAAEEVARTMQGSAGQLRGYMEHRIVRRDGEVRNMAVRYVAIEGQQGRILGTYGANQDITDRKRNEEALAAAEGQLRQAQKMEAVGRLAGGIAHDFNNLLTAIIGDSDLVLEATAPDDPNWELVADVKAVGERAATLTRQILAFSRRQMLKPEVFCLNDAVRRVEPLLARTLGEDIQLQILLTPDLLSVEVDPGQLEQVLMNLAVNARDAMPQGGELVIETANVELDRAYCAIRPELKPGRHVMLAVSDTGCGMDEPTKAQIFEPFFTTKDVGKGTGLGLSTVLGIVQQSGGCVSVYSEPDRGTTFKIYLPSHQGVVSLEDTAAPKRASQTGSETILVVEDEAPVRSLVTRVLARSGYTVLQAGSGPEAEAVLASSPTAPDLLLTDVVLPGGRTGRQVAECVHERHPGLPVVFMSGYTQDSAVLNGSLGVGADFMEKPFTPNVLLAKVRGVLDDQTRRDLEVVAGASGGASSRSSRSAPGAPSGC